MNHLLGGCVFKTALATKPYDYGNLEQLEGPNHVPFSIITINIGTIIPSISYSPFNPSTGRFLSEEPLGIDGPNLYWYARNNPVNYIDPNGTFPALILVPAAYYFGVGVGATYNYFFTDVGFGQTFSEATPFSSYLDFLVPGLGFFADINTFRYFNNLFNNQRQKDIDDAYQGQNGENQPSGSPLITNCL